MPAPVPVENRAELPAADFAALAEVASAHRSMKHVLDWAPPAEPAMTLGVWLGGQAQTGPVAGFFRNRLTTL